MYHRVASVSVDPWRLAVSAGHFEDQVRTLRQHADIVPLSQLRESLRQGRGSRPAVAITFDDGYTDNLEVAKPILEHYQSPATVFLATGFIGHRGAFWWDRLAETVLRPDSLPATIALGDGGNALNCDDPRLGRSDSEGQRARRRLHDRLWDWLNDRPQAERSSALDRLEGWAGVRRHDDRSAWPMTADEVRQLAAGELIDVGAHTVSHPRLTRLSRREKQAEIGESRSECRRILGVEPSCFAFPNGDYDTECVELVREAGFAVACTSRADLVWASGDVHQMPRISVGNVAGAALLRELRIKWLP